MAKTTTPIDKESEVYVKNVGSDLTDKKDTINCLLEVVVDKLNSINTDLEEVYRRLDELES